MHKTALVANVSLLAGAACLATALAGETKTAPAPSTPAAAAQAKPPKPPKVVTHTVTGTLESYDATAKTLTVKSTKATWTFSASEARVWEGSKSIGLDDLSSHTGSKVTVKYSDDGGQKSASSVRLPAPRPAKGSSKSK